MTSFTDYHLPLNTPIVLIAPVSPRTRHAISSHRISFFFLCFHHFIHSSFPTFLTVLSRLQVRFRANPEMSHTPEDKKETLILSNGIGSFCFFCASLVARAEREEEAAREGDRVLDRSGARVLQHRKLQLADGHHRRPQHVARVAPEEDGNGVPVALNRTFDCNVPAILQMDLFVSVHSVC